MALENKGIGEYTLAEGTIINDTLGFGVLAQVGLDSRVTQQWYNWLGEHVGLLIQLIVPDFNDLFSIELFEYNSI